MTVKQQCIASLLHLGSNARNRPICIYHNANCCQAQGGSCISTAWHPSSPHPHLHSSAPSFPQHSILWPTFWKGRCRRVDCSHSLVSLLQMHPCSGTSPEWGCHFQPVAWVGWHSQRSHCGWIHLNRPAASEPDQTRWDKQSTIHAISVQFSTPALLQRATQKGVNVCLEVPALCAFVPAPCIQKPSILLQS